MKRIIFLILTLIVISLISGCVVPQNRCTNDNDCVEKTCCHPTEAVNAKYGPDCKGLLCTAECKPGTTDCGQGEVKCIKNKCEVVLK